MKHPPTLWGAALVLALSLLTSACSTLLSQGEASPLANTHWQLLSIQSMDDAQGTTRIEHPEAFTLQLGAEGRASLRLDCNRGTASWHAQAAAPDSGTFTFGPLAATRALCAPPRLDERIARDLGYVRSFLLRDGRLYLSLMADGAIYEWAPMGTP